MARHQQPDDSLIRGAAVTLDELAATCGMPTDPHAIETKLRSYGVEYGTDWAGRVAVPVETAAAVYRRWRAEADAHSAKHDAYAEYLRERQRQAEQEQREAAAAAREESRRRNRRMLEQDREVQAQRSAWEAAQQQAEEQARRGNPVRFEDFG